VTTLAAAHCTCTDSELCLFCREELDYQRLKAEREHAPRCPFCGVAMRRHPESGLWDCPTAQMGHPFPCPKADACSNCGDPTDWTCPNCGQVLCDECMPGHCPFRPR
jgi:hypothetical protein